MDTVHSGNGGEDLGELALFHAEAAVGEHALFRKDVSVFKKYEDTPPYAKMSLPKS